LCKEFQQWPWFGCSSTMMGLVHRFFDYDQDEDER